MNYEDIKFESNKNINHLIWKIFLLNPHFTQQNIFPKIVNVR